METGAAIVIVTYNSEQTICDCLNSVTATMRPCDEVLVVDNKSQDKTIDLVQQYLEPASEQIKFLPQSKNTGFSRGCNIGIENSDKEYVILLNPDTVVFSHWIERLTAHFDFYERTGAVGALSNRVLSTQSVVTYFPDFEEYIKQGNDLIAKIETAFYKKSVPVRLLMGFCMALRRDLIEKYGALDEDIFLGDDDLEISWRLREKGYLLRVALDVYVDHERQVSFSSMPEEEAESIVRDGSDVLLQKMIDYYKPAKVPNPRNYFGINWWNPRVLETTPPEDIFDMNILPCQKQELLPTVHSLVKQGKLDDAVNLLEKFLHIVANEYLWWFTLGSIYLVKEDYSKAEFALKNAWAYEVGDNGRAGQKLVKLAELNGKKHR